VNFREVQCSTSKSWIQEWKYDIIPLFAILFLTRIWWI